MQIIATRRLREFWTKHANAEDPFRAWASAVKRASWSSPQDVKSRFGTTVDFLGDNRVVFDIGGDTFRIVAHISYKRQVVFLKFVGTHREYDGIDAEAIGR